MDMVSRYFKMLVTRCINTQPSLSALAGFKSRPPFQLVEWISHSMRCILVPV